MPNASFDELLEIDSQLRLKGVGDTRLEQLRVQAKSKFENLPANQQEAFKPVYIKAYVDKQLRAKALFSADKAEGEKSRLKYNQDANWYFNAIFKKEFY